MTRPLDSSVNSVGSSANYQNSSPIATNGGSLVSASPQFGMVGSFENENYNFGLVAGLSALSGIGFTGMDLALDAGLRIKPNWKHIGRDALLRGAVSLVALGLLEAGRSNNAKYQNEKMIKSLQAPSRPNPFNTSTQA